MRFHTLECGTSICRCTRCGCGRRSGRPSRSELLTPCRPRPENLQSASEREQCRRLGRGQETLFDQVCERFLVGPDLLCHVVGTVLALALVEDLACPLLKPVPAPLSLRRQG